MIREDDPRFIKLERKIGLFILAALAGIALFALLIGIQRNLFTPKYTLHFTVDRGTGFTKGMPVKLSGFSIGRIKDLTLNDQAMVDITVEIDRKYSKWIRKDSSVKLVKEGLIGESIVEVAVGSQGKPEIKNGDTLSYQKTKALDELVTEIGDKVKPVLIEVRDIIGYVNDPNGDLKKSIRNIEQLTGKLDKTRALTDDLLIATNRNMTQLTERTNGLLDSTTRTLDNLQIAKLNTSLEKLPPLLDKTDAAMANIGAITAQTRTLTEQTYPLLPGLLFRTEELLSSTDRLMNTLNNSWLFGGGTPLKSPSRLKAGDSHD